MKTERRRKLHLGKESLRTLGSRELRVAGGDTTDKATFTTSLIVTCDCPEPLLPRLPGSLGYSICARLCGG